MEPVRLTGTEWAVLDCLWEKAPQTMTQLARTLSAREGWAKGTTTTVLRRMTDKGLLACTQEGRARQYAPAVDRPGRPWWARPAAFSAGWAGAAWSCS